jgi:transposase
MAYIVGVDRDQQVMFPESLDEYVGAENPVRAIDAFVATLNLNTLGVQRAIPSEMGRPAYDPGDLLRLYIYGYLHRIRSSRKLECETQRNLELMWLLRKLTPDFKTIADFRRDNATALTAVCRAFTLLCRELDLFGAELVAIDGSKFRAVNSKQRNVTLASLDQRIARIDTRIAEYLVALDAADTADGVAQTPSADSPRRPGGPSLREKLDVLRTRRTEYAALKTDLEQTGERQRSLTDPESRLMKYGQGVHVCYNVQTAVDAKHKLIAAHGVTNEPTDHHQLVPMATAAQTTLGVDTLEVLADAGYSTGDQLVACAAAGITAIVPRPATSMNAKRGLFTKAAFRYDASRDEYDCPAGESLAYRRSQIDRGGRTQRVYTTAACRGCPLRPQCTRSTQRVIQRWEHEAQLDAVARRVAERPDARTLRHQLSEHPFGSMKRWMDQGYFLLRGLVKVRGEFSLTVLAYNFRRVLTLIGMPRLLEVLQAKGTPLAAAGAA